MGKVISIPKADLFLRLRSNSNEGILYFRYFVCGRYLYQSTDIRLQSEQWDSASRSITSAHKDWKRLNSYLDEQRVKYDNMVSSYKGRITPDVIRHIFDGVFTTKENESYITDFFSYAHEYNKQRYDIGKISYSTYDNGRLYIESFRKYVNAELNKTTLMLSELTVSIINQYITWRLNVRHNTKEGINKTLTPIIKAVVYAADNELISISAATAIKNTYLQLKERNYSDEVEDDEKRYLTSTQMSEFIKLKQVVTHDRTREIMDMFLFSFYACGLRVSDIISLEWSHIDFDKKQIAKNMVKTKESITIPLNDSAIEILNQWKGRNKRFVFDLLPENFDISNPKALKNARISKNRTLQQSLRSVGEKMGLPFNLTMHVARHTFAVLSLQRGVNVHIISKLLGHAGISVTEKVYAEFMPEDLNTEVREKLTFNFL